MTWCSAATRCGGRTSSFVVEELVRRRPELRIRGRGHGRAAASQISERSPEVTVIAHVTQSALPAFKTKILYFPAPDLPSYLSPANAVVVHALMSMASLDACISITI